MWRVVRHNLLHMIWAIIVYLLIYEIHILKTALDADNFLESSYLPSVPVITSMELPDLTCNLQQHVDDQMNFLQSYTTMELAEFKAYLQETLAVLDNC